MRIAIVVPFLTLCRIAPFWRGAEKKKKKIKYQTLVSQSGVVNGNKLMMFPTHLLNDGGLGRGYF